MLNHSLKESDPKQTQMWAKTSFYCGGEVLNLFSTAVSFLSFIAAPPEPKRSSDGEQKESGYLPMDSGLSNYCILLSFNIKESKDFRFIITANLLSNVINTYTKLCSIWIFLIYPHSLLFYKIFERHNNTLQLYLTLWIYSIWIIKVGFL